MMRLEDAPRVGEDNQHECPICTSEGTYVLYEGDKMCAACGHVPGVSNTLTSASEDDEWAEWREHRHEEYSGWYGRDRIKMVGGFVRPYVDDF